MNCSGIQKIRSSQQTKAQLHPLFVAKLKRIGYVWISHEPRAPPTRLLPRSQASVPSISPSFACDDMTLLTQATQRDALPTTSQCQSLQHAHLKLQAALESSKEHDISVSRNFYDIVWVPSCFLSTLARPVLLCSAPSCFTFSLRSAQLAAAWKCAGPGLRSSSPMTFSHSAAPGK